MTIAMLFTLVKRSIILFILFFIIHPVSLFSQVQKVRYLGIENGLSNNAVTSIFQDHNGFIWVGTYDGLNRYDGYGFKVFRNILGDTNTISSNGINAIEEDDKHNLWVCNQKDVNVLNPLTQRFSKPKYTFVNGKSGFALTDNVVNIKAIKSDLVLVGTQHNGLFRFEDIKTGKQIALNAGGRKLTNYYVNAIEYNPKNEYAYAFVDDYGLCKYDFKSDELVVVNDYLKNSNCLKFDLKGRLWIGTNTGLYYYSEKENSVSKSITQGINSVVNIYKEDNGDLWISTDGLGIWILEEGKETATPLNKSQVGKDLVLNSNAIYSIYIDRNHRKWVGTLRGGVNIIEPILTQFKKVQFKQENAGGSVNNFIAAFCEDDNENIWVGTDGGGLYYWNKIRGSFKMFTHSDADPGSLSSNFITSIVKDKRNNVWVSTWFGGINKFNRNSQSFKQYECYNQRTHTGNANVWRLHCDSKGRLWASAVRNGGVFIYNEKSDKFEEFDNKLNEIQVLAHDNNGVIWGGDYSSLIRFDTIKKEHKVYNIGFTIRSICTDKYGNFWIGTQGSGLLLFNRQDGTFKRFTTNEGLPNNTILNILEDKQSRLWLSTYNGMSCFDYRKSQFINYSSSDGLQSNLFSYNAAYKSSGNQFFFGGIKGFNLFYPDSIAITREKPKILLDGFTINNLSPDLNQKYTITAKGRDKPETIEVPFDKGTLTFNYLAIDYLRTSEIKYAYRLKGWDKQWNYVNSVRTALYSRLGPGEYTFEVMASTTEGMWSNPTELVYVRILPPWYRTWWAYCLYTIAVFTIIYLIVAYQKKQASFKYKIKVAKMETQKERELTEKKIEFFTNISHEFRAPLSLILNPVTELQTLTDDILFTSKLNVVQRNASRLLRLVNQLLLFEKAEEEMDKLSVEDVDLKYLCEEVYLYFAEQAKVKGVEYKFISSAGGIDLLADKDKLEIALFNILSNSLKFTPKGGSVIFRLDEDDKNILISIEDSGIGIPEAEKEKVFKRFTKFKNKKGKSGFGIGLYLAKKFVEAHKGTIHFTSSEGKGTTFYISLHKQDISSSEIGVLQKKSASEKLPDLSSISNENNNKSSEFEGTLLHEIIEDEEVPAGNEVPEELISEKQAILFIDDDNDLRKYLTSFFSKQYKVYSAEDGETGIDMARNVVPDLIITDVVMKALDGISLCNAVKNDSALAHVPVIVLSGNTSNDTQLLAMSKGADDYIKKPFDIDILSAKVKAILKRRNVLQEYFFNEITLGSEQYKVSPEYKEFIELCIKIIDEHLQDDKFSIKFFSQKLGMSHSNLYKKIKAVSGLSINGFIRFIRLKKAAEYFINSELNVNETANLVGYYNVKYFRLHFQKLYGVTPSEYIKKYRKQFHNKNTVGKTFKKQ